MFNNIGGKIKGLAYTVAVLGIIASVIGAIVLWAANSRYNNTVGTGFIVLFGGCIGSWVGGFFTYGFGELIDQQAAIISCLRKPTKAVAEPNKTADALAPAQKITASPINLNTAWTCPKCGSNNAAGQLTCKGCGRYK